MLRWGFFVVSRPFDCGSPCCLDLTQLGFYGFDCLVSEMGFLDTGGLGYNWSSLLPSLEFKAIPVLLSSSVVLFSLSLV